MIMISHFIVSFLLPTMLLRRITSRFDIFFYFLSNESRYSDSLIYSLSSHYYEALINANFYLLEFLLVVLNESYLWMAFTSGVIIMGVWGTYEDTVMLL